MNRAPLGEAIRRIQEEWCETAATPPASRERLRVFYRMISRLPEADLRRLAEDLFGPATVERNPDGTFTYTWTADREGTG